jgi:hypothetical protein
MLQFRDKVQNFWKYSADVAWHFYFDAKIRTLICTFDKGVLVMQKTMLYVLIVLVFMLGLPATLLAQDVINVGDTVTGEADGADVEYTIELTGGEIVEFDLQSDGNDPKITILDSNGTELADDDDGGATGLNSLLLFEVPEDGTYTVVIGAGFGVPDWPFTLIIGASDSEALQPGDSITDEATGNVGYNIDLEADQTITINVTSPDFDTLLEVQDDTANVLESDDDSGDGTNSRITFTAPETGTYILYIRSFSGDADGEFTLSIESTKGDGGDGGAGVIEYGQTLEIDPDGTISNIFTFEGTEGDVINLYAVSGGSEDSRLYLNGPDGTEVAQDDDSGGASNPYIRRIMLPETGTYEINLQGYGESALFETITLTLELTEILEITADGVTVTLGEEFDSEVLSFEAVDDDQYLLSVEVDEDLESSLYIYLMQEDESYASTQFMASGASSFAAVFTADETGIIRVELQYYGFSGDVDFTIAIEPLK